MKRLLLSLTALFLLAGVGTAKAQSPSLSIPAVQAEAGQNIDVAINASDFTDIGAITLVVNYDPSVITFNGLNDTYRDGFSANATGGEVRIAWFDATASNPINLSSGKLLDMDFSYVGGESALSFTSESEIADSGANVLNVSYSSGVVATDVAEITLGSVTNAQVGDTISVPLSAPSAIEGVGSASISINYDAAVLSPAEDLFASDTGLNLQAGTPEPGTVNIAGFNVNGATLQGQFATLKFVFEGGSSALSFGGNSTLTDVNAEAILTAFAGGTIAGGEPQVGAITIPDVNAQVGDTVLVPVMAENLTGVGSASLVVNFNGAAAEFVEARNGIDNFSLTVNSPSAGEVRIGGFNAAGIDLSGKIVDLAYVYNGGSSDFSFDEANSSVTEVSGASVSIDYTAGTIVAAIAPEFTAVLPDTSIAEGDTLSFMYEATDANGDALTYELVTAPMAATIDAQTGEFMFPTDFESAGEYEVVAAVSDGQLSDTTAMSLVVVTDVNRALAFTQVLSDTTIVPGDSLSFTYEAVDEDGDEVSYSLVDAPVNAEIDDLSGLFTFKPSNAQVGEFSIMVRATDGEFADTTSAVVTVDAPMLTIAGARALEDGSVVTVEGVISRAMGTDIRFQDETAGIAMYDGDEYAGFGVELEAGDRIQVTGERSTFNGVAQIDPASITVLDDEAGIPAAVATTVAEIVGDCDAFESELVSLDVLFFNTEDETFQNNETYTVSTLDNGEGDSIAFRVQSDSQTELGGMSVPERAINYTGVVGEFRGTCQLIPVRSSDIEQRGVSVDDQIDGPQEFALQGNYPNPFTVTTTLRFDLPQPAEVSVKVVDLLGREVLSVPAEQFAAGSNRTLELDGSRMASGMYIYRLEAVTGDETRVSTGKMTLVK